MVTTVMAESGGSSDREKRVKRHRTMEATFSRFLLQNNISMATVECLEKEDILSRQNFCDLDVVELMLFSSRGVAIGQISKLRIMYEEMRGQSKCSGDAPTVAASLSSPRPKLCSEARPQRPIKTQSPQGWFHIIKPHKLLLSCPVIIFNDSFIVY